MQKITDRHRRMMGEKEKSRTKHCIKYMHNKYYALRKLCVTIG